MKDFDSNFVSAKHSKDLEKEKKRKKITGTRKYKKHLKDLATIPGYFPSGAYYFEHWSDKTRKSYYKRYYRARRSSYIKRVCNRAIRRCKFLLQRGDKNKYTEFWWEYD